MDIKNNSNKFLFSSFSPDSLVPSYIETQGRQEKTMDGIISLDDINEVIIKRFNAYIKKTCKHALYKSYRQTNKDNTIYVSMFDDASEQAVYIDKGLMEIESVDIHIMGYRIKLDADLVDALNKLPEKLRITLVLNIVVDMPIKSIAKILGVSERTINTYKKQALEKIRKELVEYGE